MTTHLSENILNPVIQFGSSDEAFLLVRRDVVRRVVEVVLRERFDVVEPEDVVCGFVGSNELEERFRVGGCVEDVSPIDAFCRRNIVGNLSASNRDSGKGAGFFLVRRDGVVWTVALSDVVSDPIEIRGCIFDDFDVWMESVEIEGMHSTLESSLEDNDSMEVVSPILVLFFCNFAPVEMGEGGKEVGEGVLGEFPVGDL